ncbi:MAG TPA: tRNA (adenosine(37)-N6)-dimethylallyltransferase MiaA [Sphaerochaeta sp.]|nr:tRNA (adenosine(37)-N6)-dimethylallyltransferase MiaA [Sphaerochaeta sp.]HQB54386.1 tRNA (adenosine(37)-N6)-dimethylallyltransferase MiaA [Sphaerochaeta sp.]
MLFGPTAVGKTAILSRFDSSRYSVINADSIQVYKDLDIGSAKATAEERAAIEHHLIDIREADQSFSVGDFIQAADEAVALIHSRNKIPIISGGTAFYVKHFLYGLSEAPSSDEEVRARVGALIEEKGLVWAHKRLKEVDPVSADRIHPNDTYRISRALEVYEQSGKPLSFFDLPSEPRIVNPVLIIGLERERQDLLDRLKRRIAQMESDGLVEEIRSLFRQGARSTWPSMAGIGYREFFELAESGEYSVQSVLRRIERNTKLYTKRQMTFFRSFATAEWFDADDVPSIIERVEAFVRSEG